MADTAALLIPPPPGSNLPAILPTPKRPVLSLPATATAAPNAQQLLLAQMLTNGNAQQAADAQQATQAGDLVSTINQAGQNSRTPVATGLNLLAEALARHNQKSANTALIQDVMAERANAAQRAMNAANPPPDSSAPASPATPPQAAAAPSTDPNASVEDDVRNAVAAVNAKAAAGSTPSPSGPSDNSSHAAWNAATSPSGGALMIGGPEDSASLGAAAYGIAPGASSPTPTSTDGNPVMPATPGGDDQLLNALMKNAAGTAPPAGFSASSLNPGGASSQALLAQAMQGGGQGAPAAPQMGGGAQPGVPPDLSSAAMQGQGQGPPGFGGAAGPAAGSSAARVGPPITPADRDALIRMVYGEARGEQVQGQAATAAVALNRSILSGQPVSAVVNASGQFEGMGVGANLDPRSPDYARIASVVDPLLSGGAADPSGGATHFYSPGAQAALGRAPPSWAQGVQGQQIGRQMFYRLPFGGVGGSGPQAQMLAARGLPQGSYQVAQNGGQLPVPAGYGSAGQGGPQTGATPPPSYGNPQAAPAAPQGQPQPQFGPPMTQRERYVVSQLISSPDAGQRQQAMDILASIQARQLAPISMDARYSDSTGSTTYTPKTPGYGHDVTVGPDAGWRAPLPTGMAYSAQGTAQAIPGTGYTDVGAPAPGVVAQRDAQGKLTFSEIPNAAGAAPAGTAWNGHAYTPVPGASYGAPAQVPGTDAVAQRAPDGSFKGVGSLQLGPKDLQAIQSGYASTEEAKNYSEALAARRAMGVAAAQANGAGDYAMLDTYARAINPGAVARLGTIEAIKQSRDVPAQIQGEVQRWGPNGGTLSPSSRQQLLNTTDAFVGSRWQALQPRLQDAYAFAQRNDVDPRAVVPSFTPPQPPQAPGGGGQANSASVIAFARRAVQQGKDPAAVRARLQQMGVDPRQAGL